MRLPDRGSRSGAAFGESWRLPARAALEAATLTEAFHVSEAHRPDAIALSADITGDMGLDMFLHLVDALSIALLVYGDRASDAAAKASEVHSLRSAWPRRRSRKSCLTSSWSSGPSER
jgi:hypothetical protein